MTLPATPDTRRHRAPVFHPAGGRRVPPSAGGERQPVRQPPTPARPSSSFAGPARSGRSSSFPGRPVPSDLVRLCALRVVQDAGPIAGLDALNRLAPLAKILGEAPPTFPVLHDLEDRGLLEASASLPRTYAITASGRREAGRLANALIGLLAERLGTGLRLEAMLARRH